VNCENIRPYLAVYVDGDLSSTLAEHVEEHIATCPLCAAELADIRIVTALLGLWRIRSGSDSLVQAILDKTRPKHSLKRADAPFQREVDISEPIPERTPPAVLPGKTVHAAKARRTWTRAGGPRLRWVASAATIIFVVMLSLWAWRAPLKRTEWSGLPTVSSLRQTLSGAVSREHVNESATACRMVAAAAYGKDGINAAQAMLLGMIADILADPGEDGRKADAAGLLGMVNTMAPLSGSMPETAGPGGVRALAALSHILTGASAFAEQLSEDVPADGASLADCFDEADKMAGRGQLSAAISLLEGVDVPIEERATHAIRLADLYLRTGSPDKARDVATRAQSTTASEFRASLLHTIVTAADAACRLKTEWITAATTLALERKRLSTKAVLIEYQNIFSMQVLGLDLTSAVQTLADMLKLQEFSSRRHGVVPSRAETLCRYGWCLHQLGRTQEAVDAFLEAESGPEPEMAILAGFEAALIHNAGINTHLALGTLRELINRPETAKHPELLELIVFQLGYIMIEDAREVKLGIDVLRSKEISSFHLRALADAVIERAIMRQAG